jgi:hypothetical protein
VFVPAYIGFVAELTKTVDNKPLTADQFAYVGDPKDISTWHLPIDKDHIESALKMFGHEKHVPEAAMGARLPQPRSALASTQKTLKPNIAKALSTPSSPLPGLKSSAPVIIRHRAKA